MSRRVGTALLLTLSTLGVLFLIGQILGSPEAPSYHAVLPRVTAHPPLAPIQRSTQTSSRPAPERRPHRSASEIDHQDSYNHTRAFKHYLSHQRHERPAYQHLPYRGEEADIEIADITSDGRLILKVIPLGMNVNPRIAYRRFLARYRDPGRAYLPEYGRYEP